MAWYTGTTSGNHYLDLLDKLINIMTSNSLATAAVSSGGTGYVVGDVCTLVGGTFSPSAAKVRVTSVAAGVVDGIVIEEGGAYTVNPSSPASTTGGTGSGLTVSVTFASNGWTKNMDNTPSGEREVWLEGTGAGSDEVHVGIKTFNALSQGGIDQAYNWGVCAATGHNGGLDWWEQPGISPGFDGITGSPSTLGGAFVPLKTTDATYPIDYWISVTPRRIIVIAKVENASVTHYASLYAGFMNQYGTTSEYPYPIYVSGSSYRYNTHFATSSPRFSGIGEVMGSTSLVGPAFYRTFDSTWQIVKNSNALDTGSPTRQSSEAYNLYPSGRSPSNELEIYDAIITNNYGFDWTAIIPTSGLPGTAIYRLMPTPNTGDDLYPLIPCTVVAAETDGGRNDIDILGELDNVWWITGGGGISSEDYVEISNVRYRIFQNGNRSEIFSFMAIEES